MATAKESVQQTLDHLPDQASWDDIMYELKEGRTVSHEEAKRRLLGNAD